MQPIPVVGHMKVLLMSVLLITLAVISAALCGRWQTRPLAFTVKLHPTYCKARYLIRGVAELFASPDLKEMVYFLQNKKPRLSLFQFF